ncbi:putative inorganic phosphate cotransporter [Anabrus simplex]|uniref:putative inorganic phosphate cotransporter n=1 Tax=Anabrus simplex TaxID=316456 RepID=UPI0034DCFF3B
MATEVNATDAEKQTPSNKEYGTASAKLPLLGVRHIQGLLMFLCLLFAYALRVNLSVGIVAMMNNTENANFPEYDWDDTSKANILSSFFWGYVVTQVPGGELAQRFGPKYLMFGSLIVGSLFAILTPLAASVGGWGLVCASRVVQGLSQGVLFPSIHTLLAKWAPIEERGRMATYVYAGSQVGTIIAMPICGLLIPSSAGWPSVFYVFGGLGIAWAVLWFFMGSNRPSQHPFISEAERKYIEDSIGSDSVDPSIRKPPTPWKAIFTSLPMWSIIIVHCGQNWGFWTLLTEMPSYMSYVLKFDIKDNSLLSALPYLVSWIMSFFFSFAADYIQKKNWMSLAASRKLFNTIAHWLPGIALIALAFTDDSTAAVALLTVAVGVNSATYVGFQLNHIDISPNFAGTMMGITNALANIMSILGPLFVGIVVTDQESQYQWRVVFFVSAGFYFVGNLIFILFGKGTVQPWNEPVYPEDAVKDQTTESRSDKEKE